MQKFRHTRRSVFLFLLLTPLTLLIYPIVVMTHIGKDVNRMNEGKEGYKKSMNYVGVFFLGLITFGIVPLVWTCRVSRKIGEKGAELGIAKPHTSAISYFMLCFLFSFLIITFIIGLCKLFHTCNAVERKLNEQMDAKALAEAEADILPSNEAPAEEVPALEQPKEEPKPEEKPAEEPKAEEPKPEAKEEPKPEAKEEPAPAPAAKPRRWQVRVPNSDEPIRVFDTKEEAVAYAKGLAMRKHASVRVKN